MHERLNIARREQEGCHLVRAVWLFLSLSLVPLCFGNHVYNHVAVTPRARKNHTIYAMSL